MDSWSGYSSNGITCIIPLLGDILGNNIDFWELSDFNAYSDGWISPPLILDGFDWERQKDIIKNYKKVNFERKRKQMFLFDASTLHATRRNFKCGTRFSIDNIFIPKLKNSTEDYGEISANRKVEIRTFKKLLKIGEEEIFNFPDDDNQINDSKGGSIDPINWKLMKINNFKT